MRLMYYFLLSEFWSCQKCERTGKLYPSIFWEKLKTYISTHCCDHIQTSLLDLTVRQLADAYIIATLDKNGLSKTHGNVVVVAGGLSLSQWMHHVNWTSWDIHTSRTSYECLMYIPFRDSTFSQES